MMLSPIVAAQPVGTPEARPRRTCIPRLPVALVAARDPMPAGLGSYYGTTGRPVVVADTPEDVCAPLRGSHALRLILYGPDDVGAAAVMAASELLSAGWAVSVLPTPSIAGMACVGNHGQADADAIRSLLVLAQNGSLGPTDAPGPVIQDLPLRSRRIYVNSLTGAIVVDGVERQSVQGVLSRLLLYLNRNHEREVSRLEAGVQTEVFGALPTRKTWNNALYRLRIALGDSRDVLQVTPNHARVRTQRRDRLT